MNSIINYLNMPLGRDQTSLMVAQACLSLLQTDHKSYKCNLRNAGTDLRVGGSDLRNTGTDLRIAGADLCVSGTDLWIAGTDLWVTGTDLWTSGIDLQILQRTLNNK